MPTKPKTAAADAPPASFDPATLINADPPAASTVGPEPSTNGQAPPTIESPPVEVVPAQDAASGNGPDPKPNGPATSVLLEIPLGECAPGYAQDSYEFRGMTPRQRAGAKRMFYALAQANERIQTNGQGHPAGKVVHLAPESVKWVFERYADAYEAQTGRAVTEGLTF